MTPDLHTFLRALGLKARRETAPESDLATNGDFSSATGWTAPTGWVIAGGKATKTASAAEADAEDRRRWAGAGDAEWDAAHAEARKAAARSDEKEHD